MLAVLNIDLTLEIGSTLLGLAYLFFLIRENSICWLFGIAGSLMSLVLFYRTGLYSEAILYGYYVFIGVYGYRLWTKNVEKSETLKISKTPFPMVLISIGAGLFGAIGLGYYFSTYSDAESPYFDAFTTAFSFVASYLEAKKYLSAWFFWIGINGATIFLYESKNLSIYMLLTIVYFLFSFVGYVQWKKALVPGME